MNRSLSFGVPFALLMLAGAAVVLSEDERGRVCHKGFSQSLRLEGAAYRAVRDAAFARAGIPVSQQCHKNDPRPDCMILDHRQPLELDPPNPNAPDNLQVQTRVAAALKDLAENEARREYCAPGSKLTQEEALARFKRSTP